MSISRRSFLQAGATALVAASAHTPLLAALRQRLGPDDAVSSTHVTTLATGWEHYRGPLDARFQVWQSQELVVWEQVELPHCFNHYDGCDPETPAYRGPGWYRTKLAVDNPYPGGRTLLHFEGAGQRAEVYIGTHKVDQHEGGYDEFLVDITEACHATANSSAIQLSVLCDNSRNIDAMPSDLSDFTLYGGLYRPVHLAYVPAVAFEAVHTHVQYQPDADAQVRITARVYNPAQSKQALHLEVTLFNPQGREVHRRAVQQNCWEGELELSQAPITQPQPWSPDAPNLYRCRVTLTASGGVCTVEHRFGIRHTRFEEHGPFFLNGQRLLLRGTHRHEDHAGYAAAMPEELIRREMTMIKDMGANFIRLAHYQQRALVLDLCDELGLLVWEELPWCRSGVGSAAFQEQGKTLLRTMIDQHRNHPCILVWGLGNEDDWPTELNGKDHATIRQYMQELRDLAHLLDPDRLTAYRRCDFARDIPDVYSPSIWAGWYSGRYTEYAAALDKARTSVPHFLHMEWGADSHAGRHAEDPDPALAQVTTGHGTAEQGFDYKLSEGPARMAKDGGWTETYACELFDWYLKTMEETPWLTGAAMWAFKDFTTPLRVENPIPRVNQKGVAQRDLTPKEGYFVFQSWWARKPMLHIYGHSWPIRWGADGQRRTVRVYSNCREVELFLNGVSVGARRRDPAKFPACGLTWDLSFREGQNELRAVAHGGATPIEDRIVFTYQTQPWKAPAKLTLTRTQQTGDLVTVEARVFDANGVPCLDARTQVTFSVAGEARLRDNLGTTAGSRVVQLANGRAVISLTQHGPAEAGVAAHGVTPAFLPLP